MLKIDIQTIPHKKQRYDTIGDYFIDGSGVIHFRVSDLGQWQFEAAVILHELVEFFWVKMMKVPISAIDSFDIRFEEEREMGLHGKDDEPGDDPNAPYHIGHCLATGIERIFIAATGKSWESYCIACENASAVWKERGRGQRSKHNKVNMVPG